jgi:spore cortex biosynthesis protein YabQ
MSDQAWLFLGTVALGFALGFIFDIFRIVRIAVSHKTWMVQAEDLLYWTLVILLMFYFMLSANYGEIRLFAIVGAAIGALLYFYSLSIIIMKVATAIINFVKKVLFAIARIILTPVRFIMRKLKIPLRGLRARYRHSKKAAKRNIRVMLKKV